MKHNPQRKKILLCTAIGLSIKLGYQNITRDQIAESAGVSNALINRYFGTMDKLKKQVVRTAIKQEVMEILEQALGMRDSQIAKIPDTLKHKILAHMAR